VVRPLVVRPLVVRPLVVRPLVVRPLVVRPLVVRPLVVRPPGAPGRLAAIADVAGAALARRERPAATRAA
jgi:hypothetical protein